MASWGNFKQRWKMKSGRLISGARNTRYVNTAEKLLLLYLHGFMQEQKELEAEKG